MNYIHKLEAENRLLKSQQTVALHFAEELWNYANSEKFMGEIEDQYINKKDIFLRLEPILRELR